MFESGNIYARESMRFPCFTFLKIKTMKKNLFFLILPLLIALNAGAITFKENLLFSAELDASQVIPAVNSGGKGIGAFMLNKNRDSVSVAMSFIGLSGSPVGVKIYQGSETINGTLLTDLSAFISGNQVKTNLGGAIVAALLTDLYADHLYVVVETQAHSAGEIRGQVKLEADLNFVGDLNGLQAVPVVAGTAYGLGSFSLSKDKSTFDYRIVCRDLTGVITAAELHFGASGQTGALAEDLTASVFGNVIYGTLQPSAQFLDSLFKGKIYLNVITANNPTGEIRSQLINYKGLSFEAIIDGSQMVPAITTPAVGVSVIRLSTDLDTLYYDAVFDGIATSIDYAHLHIGYAGAPYGSLSVDFSNSIAGNRIKGMKTGASINSSIIKRLLISNLTYIVHTAAYPNGEIRGAVIRYAREGLTINCSGSQVVSPVTTAAYGTGIVSINRNDDNLHYLWMAGNLSSTTTAAHFNKNVYGQNGPVLFDMTAQMNTTGNEAWAAGYWTSTTAVPFLPSNVNQFQTDSVYLELLNATYPGGELRGQVESGMVYYSPTGIATSDAFSGAQLSLFPVPASDQLNVQFSAANFASLQIEITDVTGRVVYAQRFPSALLYTIDLRSFETGIYFITVSSGQTAVSQKIIKG
jgi:CHRD domain/Secretion system C-terminal sorting domain